MQAAGEQQGKPPRGEGGDPIAVKMKGGGHPALKHAGMAALTLAALGVVFGDIGTSPLYALQTVFSIDHGDVTATQGDVYGVISLVFWSITIIVSVKYLTFIMRADNGGEGGIMALIALIETVNLKGRYAKWALVALGIFGASLFYGDGMITPAISVLSAVEGLEIVEPSLDSLVIPITLVVLVSLFAIQRFGTGAVGRLFGPVMLVWFAVLAISGLGQVLTDPSILKALSPSYGAQFFTDHFGIAFVALSAIVLAVTGAEALYADMGHFGRPPIRLAWFFVVFPALTLNYLGQGSLILGSPSSIDNPFFLLLPDWARIPVVILATLATVIASQAVISGAFSVTQQAVQLGFLPQIRIMHTSTSEAGQVFVPGVNRMLMVAVAALVIGFGSSQKLASAYGIAVTGTLAIDTILFFVVVRMLWHKPLWMVLSGAGAFLFVDLMFFSANLTKVFHGGWFPLSIAVIVFTVLITWQRGRHVVTDNRSKEEGSLQEFVHEVHGFDPPASRAPGTAVFLTSRREVTPLALRSNLEHNHVLHEVVLVVTIEIERTPHIELSERLILDDLEYEDDGISCLVARFGYQDDLDVPAMLEHACANGVEGDVDLEGATYFLSRITVVPNDEPTMRRWRKALFVGISRNSGNLLAERFRLPASRTIIMGSEIAL